MTCADITVATIGASPASYEPVSVRRRRRIPGLLRMLVAVSVIAGLGTPLGLVMLVRLGRDRTVMGSRRISGRMAIAGWAIAAVVGGLGLLYAIGAALGKFCPSVEGEGPWFSRLFSQS